MTELIVGFVLGTLATCAVWYWRGQLKAKLESEEALVKAAAEKAAADLKAKL